MDDGGRCSRISGDYRLYVGTYTASAGMGIYGFRFSGKSGDLFSGALLADTVNPSFLVLHPNGRSLYAVAEVKQHEGKPGGFVSGYDIDQDSGVLTFTGKVHSGGLGPCHVALDRQGHFAVVSNYVDGSVAVVRIQRDGKLGDVAGVVKHSEARAASSKRPHAHGAFFSGDDRFIIVPDLGLETLFVYRLDSCGILEPAEELHVELPPGSGPRHFAFRSQGDFGYVLNERNSTVTAFHLDSSRGGLQPFQYVSTLCTNFHGENAAAEIELAPDGKFLYASNRGADTIAVFAVNSQGQLKLIENTSTQGRTPRHFAIDPSGRYLIVANQDTNNLVVFHRDQATGRLTYAGQQAEIAAPACVVFAPCS